MARGVRLRCSCGRVVNAVPNQICPSCKKIMPVPQGGMIYFHRSFSIKSLTSGFGIYLNHEFYGGIGVGEYVKVPVEFGKYEITMSRTNPSIIAMFCESSTDLCVEITPENPTEYVKIWNPICSFYKIKLRHMSAEEIHKIPT